MIKNYVWPICFVTLAACATHGTPTDFKNSAVVKRTENVVWDGLAQFMTSKGLQIKTIERDSGIIYAENFTVSSEYASCDGNSGYPDQVTGVQMNLFVRELNASQTQVTVNANFNAVGINPYNHDRMEFRCYSTGRLEQELLFAAGAHPSDFQ